METTEKTTLSDDIINGVKKAIAELEEFRLQAALGKAEAQDAFESAKKQLHLFIHEAGQKLNDVKDTSKETTEKIKAAFEMLIVHLALGKAESKELFEEQRKKISVALDELEAHVKNNKTANEYYTKILLEIGKFRIKLEILKLRFELNKLEARMEFGDMKTELLKRFSEIKGHLEKKEAEAKAGWVHFSDEISDAYSQIRKLFVK